MDRKKLMGTLNSEYRTLPGKVKGWSLSRRFVPGAGPLNARVMVIGQAPGRNEDEQGKPFVGVSGRFLDRLLSIAGLDRESAYIVSVVQFFPPKNRAPTRDEIGLCKGFLFRQMDIVNPNTIILLGSVACKAVLGIGGIASVRGTAVKRDGITYLLSLHPAAAVRIRSKMPIMEDDFRKFRQLIK
ncbi:MAG: uracil-DNA glycosylase [Candidatus Micrarchaeaceae archaeon]